MRSESNRNSTLSQQRSSYDVTASELPRFLQTVNNILEDLVMRQGYSRERATKAILQEIAHSVYPRTLNVTDEQIFGVMRRYNLGMEQASRALAVSQSLDLVMEQRKMASREALVFLTDHLAKINVSIKPNDPVFEKNPTIEHPMRIILPDQSTSKQRLSSSVSNTMQVGKKEKCVVASSKNSKTDSQTRDLSDAVPEEVVAKLGEAISANKSVNAISAKHHKQSEGIPPPTSNTNLNKPNATTPATGRSKRNRDDTEMHSSTRSSGKRSRMNST